MPKVTDHSYEATGRPAFICDFSPPRSGDADEARQAAIIPAHFIAVAYNPGRAVRTNPAMLAAAIRQATSQETIFTLATRDMNKLAIQSLLLGAQMLGLENVTIVQGDPFPAPDLSLTRPVNDYRPTQLIAAIRAMNHGTDFRNAPLTQPTTFCIGATLDLSRNIDREATLAAQKIKSGANYLISQPIFNPDHAHHFRQIYQQQTGKNLPAPVFYGLQILEPGSITFTPIPNQIKAQLNAGRPGLDLALEQYRRFQTAGLRNIYLIPPIHPGGARNYAAAQEFLQQALP